MQYRFDTIVHVETAQKYIDVAFSRATKRSGEMRSSFSGSKKLDRIQKSHIAELAKVDVVKETLVTSFDAISKSFPSVDSLPEFYRELLELTLDVPQLKKSLAAVDWSKNQIKKLHKDFFHKIRRSTVLEEMNSLRRSYYGRVNSVVMQIEKDLKYLAQAKKKFKDFPTVREDVFTVAISGFPNVGKSTLLSKITTSTPEINSYAFTTKQILVGHIKEKHRHIQVLDTPGTLARLEKMNTIEKQAHLAMKYCADVLVYVFDLTITYPLEEQMRLFKSIKKTHAKDIIIYFSKIDLVPEKEIKEYADQLPSSLVKITGGPEVLREHLLDLIR